MSFDNHPGTYVAHYTRASTALDLILKNNSLRLGPFTATNDPRETKTWMFSIGVNRRAKGSESLDGKGLAKRNVDFDRLVKQGSKVLCVSRDADNAQKLATSQRCYGKARMWAHYADNHAGVCLIFDKDALDNTLKVNAQADGAILVSSPVKYWDFDTDILTPLWAQHMEAFMLSANEIAERGLEKVMLDVRDRHKEIFFFQKNRDWETEAEYRWVYTTETDDPKFVPIDESLRAIALGIDFPHDRVSEVHGYCRRYGVHLTRVLWLNGAPNVQWVGPNELSNASFQHILEFMGLS